MRKDDLIVAIILGGLTGLMVAVGAILSSQLEQGATMSDIFEPWFYTSLIWNVIWLIGYIILWSLLRGVNSIGQINFQNNKEAFFFVAIAITGVLVIMALASKGVIPT